MTSPFLAGAKELAPGSKGPRCEDWRSQSTKERLYLAEIKQFCNYYMVIADKLKMSYEMSNAGEFDELISKEELDQIDKTKDLFNRQY